MHQQECKYTVKWKTNTHTNSKMEKANTKTVKTKVKETPKAE